MDHASQRAKPGEARRAAAGNRSEPAAGHVELRIFRYDPSAGDPPRFDAYRVPVGPQTRVLDALYYVLERLDPTLAFRSACRAAVCGSCAMHINGQYRLACRTLLSNLRSRVVTIRPLAHLPVVRDLVVDMKPFFQAYESVRPYLISTSTPVREHLQSPRDRKRLEGLIDCILCGACYGGCPLLATDPHYPGPHALLAALRFVEDSRDGATHQRLAVLAGDHGAFRCHTVFNCQVVCPKDLDPSRAVARLKRRIAWHLLRESGEPAAAR